jgi:UPF0271 protein
MGERPDALRDGSEEELMKLITSANIACGYHAGDASTMAQTVLLTVKYGVGIGAHPGYPDRINFGRISIALSPDEIARMVYEQIRSLGIIARAHNAEIVHVKPHGALYADGVHNLSVGAAIAAGAAEWSKDLILVGLSGSMMLDIWQEKGFRVAPEAFADRVYEPGGMLRQRKLRNALITEPAVAVRQALQIITKGTVSTSAGAEIPMSAATISFHSDTPNAVEIARTLSASLIEAGITIRGLKTNFC